MSYRGLPCTAHGLQGFIIDLLANGSYAAVLYNEDNTYSVVHVLPTLIFFDLSNEEPTEPEAPKAPEAPTLPPEVTKENDETLPPELPVAPVVTAPDATATAPTATTKTTPKAK